MGLDDEEGAITSVYGDRNYNTFWFEGGPSLFHVVELDFGVGLMRRKGNLQGVTTGATSTELGRLSLFPVSASLTGRLELLREQWVVPFARVGADYWFWIEETDEGEGFRDGEKYSGGKPGWHYGLGVNLLLDPLDRRRANLVAARWGIDDTYFVIEWRDNRMTEGAIGLDFTGSALSFGVKVDR